MIARSWSAPNVGSALARGGIVVRHTAQQVIPALELRSAQSLEPTCRPRRETTTAAFTLLELLMVLVVIGSFAVLVFGGLKGASTASALRSAQATLDGLITVARTHALSTGKTTRIIVNIDPITASDASRFLRFIAVQAQTSTGWETITEVSLPGEIYLVPGDFVSLPAGLFASGLDAWVRVDGATSLRSSALRSAQITTEVVESETAQRWVNIAFSATGTTAQSGDLILTAGRNRAPGSFTLGQSPIELLNRDHVCGVTLSSYGVAVVIGDRASF